MTERDLAPVRKTPTLAEIRAYGESKRVAPLVTDVDALEKYFAEGSHDQMWETAYTAPHSYASLYDQRILVIIDEFQNLSGFICTDQDLTNIHLGSYVTLSTSWTEINRAFGSFDQLTYQIDRVDQI